MEPLINKMNKLTFLSNPTNLVTPQNNPSKPVIWVEGQEQPLNTFYEMEVSVPNFTYEPFNYQFLNNDEAVVIKEPNITMSIPKPKSPLEQLLAKYPNEKWNWFQISSNPHISWDFIFDHPGKPWCWFNLVLNKITTSKMIKDQWNRMEQNEKWLRENMLPYKWQIYPQISYWSGVVYNPNITLDLILKNAKRLSKADWNYVSYKFTITLDVLEKHPLKPWNWNTLSGKSIFTMEDIEKTLVKFPWDFQGISRNPNLTIEMIRKFYKKKWSWTTISQNPGITMDMVENNSDLPWERYGLSSNPNLTIDYIKSHPVSWRNWIRIFIGKHYTKYWNWSMISCNPGISTQDVLDNPDLPWNWYQLARNPNITLEFIEQTSTKSWNYSELSKHPKLSYDFVLKYPTKPWSWITLSKRFSVETIFREMENAKKNGIKGLAWNWEGISENPTLTIDHIEQYKNKIDFQKLSKNGFDKLI